MNETSKLSIVVDVSNAQQKLKDFTRQLNEAKKAGDQLGSSASNSSQGLNNQAQSANKAQLEANKLAISNKKVEAQNNRTASSIQGLVSAEARAAMSQNNLQASAVKLVTAGKQQEMQNNRTASSAAQLVVSNQRIAITAEQLATAQFKTVTASNQAAASNNRLSVSAIQVSTANNRLLTSAAQTAAAQTRETIATTNLARANWSLVTAATGAATAEQRLALQTSNAAAAALRAQREAVNLAAAQARLAAQADRAAGAMNGANAASRGLYGSMSKLYTLMNSGLVVVFGLGFVKQAADMQNLNNQIRLVTDSEREYVNMKKEVIAVANDNFASIDATIGLYQKSVRALDSLGKSQADSLKFTEAVSLAMRTGGRSAGENAAAILQLGQAMGAGVIMGDEFRSISENAPVLLDLVAKEMGVLRGELKKLSADGKITAEIMFNALTKNMGTLEELAKKMPLTMGQAFTVAKNKFKEYTDQMMNSTGGVSDKISGMLVKVSANFDTIAKVGMTAMVLGLISITANLATATKAMQLFNFVTSMNPLLLVASGFLLVNSAIFGTNEVLTISGLLMSDFFDGMGTMLKDGETWWMDFSNTVAVAMGITVKEVADANDKNNKNFLGFYTRTEEGFAGVVQGLGTAIGSVTAIFGTFFELLGRWTDNMITGFENMGKAAYNAGVNVRKFFGGDGETVEYGGMKSLDGWSIYKDTFNSNQDSMRDYARGLNRRAGVTEAPFNKGFSNQLTRGFDFSNALVIGKNTVLAKKIGQLPDYLKPTVNTSPINQSNLEAYTAKVAKDRAEADAKALKKAQDAQAALDKKTKSAADKSELLRLVVTGGKYYPTDKGGVYGAKRAGRPLGHQALDLSTPMGTKLYAPEGGTLTYGGSKSGGEGLTASIKTLSGVVYKFLHLNNYNHPEGQIPAGVSFASSGNSGKKKDGSGYSTHSHIEVFDKKGNRVNPTNYKVRKPDSGYDSKYADALSNQQKEAERAELERAKEAAAEVDRQLKVQLELYKQYGTKRQEINAELDAELAKIRGSGAPQDVIDEQVKQAEKEADAKYSAYADGLTRQIGALNEAQNTERQMIKQANQYLRDDANNNAELNRKGNEDFLTATLTAIDVKEAREMQALEVKLNKEYNDLYAFSLTDRQLYEKDWLEKMAVAKAATDELKQYRIDAYTAEKAIKDKLFDLSDEKTSLELRKDSMKQGNYLKQAQDIALQQIALDPSMSPERKRLENNAARQPLNDAYQAISDELNPIDPMEQLKKDYEEKLSIVDAYESQWTSLVGVKSQERLDLERSYQNAKAQLVIDQGESIMGSLSSIAKDTMGEQSGIFKAMFAMEKGFAIARSIMNIQVALSSAAASLPFPANLGAISTVAMEGASIISSLKAVAGQGFKQGGYTGSMGVNDVAGVVHGQEYVFDAKATREIGVGNLEAIRSGKSIGGDVNVTVNNMSSARVETQDDGNGNIIMTIRDEVKRSWSSLSNPNSFESKQVNRNVQAPRRR